MKKHNDENYLEKIPQHKEGLQWSVDDGGSVTLHMENKGAFNKIFQLILKKPKVSCIHLEEMGSFIWLLIDGEKDICRLGELVEERFGEKAHPVYERLSQYMHTLEFNGFITFKE